jgi:hypothetical protein
VYYGKMKCNAIVIPQYHIVVLCAVTHCVYQFETRVCNVVSDLGFHLGFEVVTQVVTKNYIFCDIIPCNSLRDSRRFGGTYCPHHHSRRISRERNQLESSWQTKPLLCSSETSVDFQRTTRHCIPEDRTLLRLFIFLL